MFFLNLLYNEMTEHVASGDCVVFVFILCENLVRLNY